ncbi:MAG: glucoamylase family protein [Bacteroidales bacterium]
MNRFRTTFFLRTVVLLACVLTAFAVSAQEYQYVYSLFNNSPMTGEYFYSRTSTGYESGLKNIKGKLPVNESFFHTPGNSLELTYKNSPESNWQAVIYPHGKRGMDQFLKPAFFSFWVFSTSLIGEEQMPSFQFMRSDESLSESFKIRINKVNAWQQIRIPLASVRNFDAEHLEDIVALVFSGQKIADKEEHTIYIDDLEFLPDFKSSIITEKPEILSARGYAMHIDLCWKKITNDNIRFVKIYRSENGIDYKAVGIQQSIFNRFADFTGETGKKYFYRLSYLNNQFEESGFSATMAAETKAMTDDELLTMVQEASFRYYWEGAESFSGMAKENIPGRQNMIASGASGFGIMALIVGTERGFIAREESVTRFVQIVNFLEKAETFHGAFPHFIDGPTGKVEPFFGQEDNGADLVETSFLMQGLLAARQYFTADNASEKLIRDKITRIWEKTEWDWFRQYPDSKFLYWHWSPDQAWVINHNLIGWNETMVTYLLAIASPTHPVPASMYYSGWANQDNTGQNYRSGWGQTTDGSMYTNGKSYFGVKLDVGVSNGGPLFFTHYSYMGYDPHLITDKYTNYFVNNQNIAKINYKYCVSNPKSYKGYGEAGWGLTASDGPFDYSADEPILWQDKGKLTPTGAISSFPYTPDESMKVLKNYYYNYGKFLWGEYGFKDAFDLTHNWCSEIYMGLNQAPMTVMIENYRTGLIWKLFMQNPEIQNGLKMLDAESLKIKDCGK